MDCLWLNQSWALSLLSLLQHSSYFLCQEIIPSPEILAAVQRWEPQKTRRGKNMLESSWVNWGSCFMDFSLTFLRSLMILVYTFILIWFVVHFCNVFDQGMAFVSVTFAWPPKVFLTYANPGLVKIGEEAWRSLKPMFWKKIGEISEIPARSLCVWILKLFSQVSKCDFAELWTLRNSFEEADQVMQLTLVLGLCLE